MSRICPFYLGSINLEGEGIKLVDVKLQAPIPRPTGVIMCIGKNYLDHVKEVDTWKTAPSITQPEAPKVYINIFMLSKKFVACIVESKIL